ncbi:pectate lyase family protein [Vibrio ziniensis]|uniref:Polysaccharide lyase family 1 protein n=1 Tax=Vibrio ziniensis TaxID=2711221 RepID=A0A6G7CGR3_9VIBR|nr:polysaccharide lyase family 1 protein [Vibrio ziniensis]QIH41279.1 polysaccharide lyase family 1 protein [Vibrio ziniensis]
MKKTFKTKLTLLSCTVGGLLFNYSVFAAQNDGLVGYATLNGGTTGGEGGEVVYATTGTQINEAMCNRAAKDTPIIIYVTGTINHDNTTKVTGNCNTTDSEIEIKGVSNISIIGTEDGAIFDEIGIHLRDTSNIIIRNIHVRNVKKSGSPISNGGDAIGMESGVSNVWIDHMELEASGGEKDGYDSLIDMKADTKFVTVSYSYLHDSDRGGLIGSGTSDTENTYITFHHNHYANMNSRLPLLRFGTAHAFNNYYDGITSSGMNPRLGGQIKAENNHFKDAQNPIGTFYDDVMGYWDVSGNIFENVTWVASTQSGGSASHPAGPDPVSTTIINIPYLYELHDASCVADVVLAHAGVGKNMSFPTDSSCGSTTAGDDTIDLDPGTPIDGGSSSEDSSSVGVNQSLITGAGADSTSKGSGASSSNVKDDNISTYWYPNLETDTAPSVWVKWGSNVTLTAAIVKEAEGFEGNITSWNLINRKTGDVLASGDANALLEPIVFEEVALTQIALVVTGFTGTPTVAELQTYTTLESDSDSSSGSDSDNLSLRSDALVEVSTTGAGSANDSIDEDYETYWSPSSTDENISLSVKWSKLTTVGAITVYEYLGKEGYVNGWELVDNNTSAILATGTSLGEAIEFEPVQTCRINLNITSTTDTPAVAEFESYAGLEE